MKLGSIVASALAFALSASVALAQTGGGSSPLTPAKGGTNSAFVGFTGPATSVKTFTLPNASDTIATLAAIQTFTAAKTFASAKLLLAGSSSGAGTLNAPAAASTYVWTLPAATDTLVARTTTDTLTNKTLTQPVIAGGADNVTIASFTGAAGGSRFVLSTDASGHVLARTANSLDLRFGINTTTWLTLNSTGALSFSGSSSGSTGLKAAAAASGTLTLPAATDTLIGKATTDTLTNKTFDTAGTGNSFSINGVAATANTGTGSVVRATSPTLVTPALGVATATSVNKVAVTAPATAATLTIPDGVTLTGPASSGTAMTLGNTETVTGVKTFGGTGAVGRLKIAGTTSGAITLDATAIAGTGTLTLPAATDTLVGKATTDTLTNKTFDTAGTGNSFSINGLAATANTGTGAVVRATSPALVTPALGTPASGVATNLTGTASGLTAGNVTTNANLTGDVTSVGNATTLTNAPVIAKLLTGFASSTGTVTAADSILTAIQKVYGNDALKAPIASPTFTGVPAAPTAAPSNNSTQIATTAYVDAQVAGGVAGVASIDTATGALTLGTGLARSSQDLRVADGVTLQTVYADLTTYTTGTTSMAGGADTIPQSTDGTQLLTASITPKLTTSKLLITVTMPVTNSAITNMWAALFQDSTAAALSATIIGIPSAETIVPASFSYQMTSGTTSATTFKIRVGNFGGSTWAVNGTSAARRLGGSQRATITVKEIKA